MLRGYNITMEIFNRIKPIIDSSDQSNSELAKALGYSPTTISRIRRVKNHEEYMEYTKAHNNTGKPKRGRPTEIKRDITKTSQSGLREGLTRATFIIREDTLDRLKQRAYDDRKKLKDIVTEALDYYLDKTKDKETNDTAVPPLEQNNHTELLIQVLQHCKDISLTLDIQNNILEQLKENN